MTRIAVIGAGLSGLVVARELGGCSEVTVFEKSRGFGGRMATRYEADFEFDHGAQFFTARSSGFQSFLEPLIREGVVAIWPARFAELDRGDIAATRDWNDAYPHFVGAPRMNEIGKYLARGLDVRRDTTVAALEHGFSAWHLTDGGGKELGRFDWVICTMPAAQTAALVPAGSTLHSLAGGREMRSCIALMLGFDEPLGLPWQAALVRGADISWVSVNSSKPGRPDRFALVVHSTNAYADAHIEQPRDELRTHLLDEASAVLGTDCGAARFAELQRWRYANADKQQGPGCFIDAETRLAACGDWFVRGRVEAAFNSGFELAHRLRAVVR